MCGRFVDPNLRGTELELSQIKISPFPRRFNVKPTDAVLIYAKDPLVGMMARWWLVPSWHKGALKDWKPTTFNARIEDAKDKPTFRAVWRHGRCLVPIGAYYEWTGAQGSKQPHVIASSGNEETMWLAGLASRWQDLLTCTIMTRAAVPSVAELHPRMPVILNPEERDAWLSGTDDTSLGAAPSLKHYPVSRFGLHDDGPQLIEEIK